MIILSNCKKALISILLLALPSISVSAQTIFSEDFESPPIIGDADGYDGKKTPTGWVRGVKGSKDWWKKEHGLRVISTSEQGYSVRHSDMGITTSKSAVTDLLKPHTKYVVTFDVVKEFLNVFDASQALFEVQLIAYPSSYTDRNRQFVYKQPADAIVLNSVSEAAPASLSTRVFEYESGAMADFDASKDYELAIRLKALASNELPDVQGNHGGVIFDKVLLESEPTDPEDAPEPKEASIKSHHNPAEESCGIASTELTLPKNAVLSKEHKNMIQLLTRVVGEPNLATQTMGFAACGVTGSAPTMFTALTLAEPTVKDGKSVYNNNASGAIIQSEINRTNGEHSGFSMIEFPECKEMSDVASSQQCGGPVAALCRTSQSYFEEHKPEGASDPLDLVDSYNDKSDGPRLFDPRHENASDQILLYEWVDGDIDQEPSRYIVNKAIDINWNYGQFSLDFAESDTGTLGNKKGGTYGISLKVASKDRFNALHQSDSLIIVNRDQAGYSIQDVQEDGKLIRNEAGEVIDKARGWVNSCGAGHTTHNRSAHNMCTNEYAVLCTSDSNWSVELTQDASQPLLENGKRDGRIQRQNQGKGSGIYNFGQISLAVEQDHWNSNDGVWIPNEKEPSLYVQKSKGIFKGGAAQLVPYLNGWIGVVIGPGAGTAEDVTSGKLDYASNGVDRHHLLPAEPPTQIGLIHYGRLGNQIGEVKWLSNLAPSRYVSFPKLQQVGSDEFVLGYAVMPADPANSDVYPHSELIRPESFFMVNIKANGELTDSPTKLENVRWGESDQWISLGRGQVGWASSKTVGNSEELVFHVLGCENKDQQEGQFCDLKSSPYTTSEAPVQDGESGAHVIPNEEPFLCPTDHFLTGIIPAYGDIPSSSLDGGMYGVKYQCSTIDAQGRYIVKTFDQHELEHPISGDEYPETFTGRDAALTVFYERYEENPDIDIPDRVYFYPSSVRDENQCDGGATGYYRTRSTEKGEQLHLWCGTTDALQAKVESLDITSGSLVVDWASCPAGEFITGARPSFNGATQWFSGNALICSQAGFPQPKPEVLQCPDGQVVRSVTPSVKSVLPPGFGSDLFGLSGKEVIGLELVCVYPDKDHYQSIQSSEFFDSESTEEPLDCDGHGNAFRGFEFNESEYWYGSTNFTVSTDCYSEPRSEDISKGSAHCALDEVVTGFQLNYKGDESQGVERITPVCSRLNNVKTDQAEEISWLDFQQAGICPAGTVVSKMEYETAFDNKGNLIEFNQMGDNTNPFSLVSAIRLTCSDAAGNTVNRWVGQSNTFSHWQYDTPACTDSHITGLLPTFKGPLEVSTIDEGEQGVASIGFSCAADSQPAAPEYSCGDGEVMVGVEFNALANTQGNTFIHELAPICQTTDNDTIRQFDFYTGELPPKPEDEIENREEYDLVIKIYNEFGLYIPTFEAILTGNDLASGEASCGSIIRELAAETGKNAADYYYICPTAQETPATPTLPDMLPLAGSCSSGMLTQVAVDAPFVPKNAFKDGKASPMQIYGRCQSFEDSEPQTLDPAALWDIWIAADDRHTRNDSDPRAARWIEENKGLSCSASDPSVAVLRESSFLKGWTFGHYGLGSLTLVCQSQLETARTEAGASTEMAIEECPSGYVVSGLSASRRVSSEDGNTLTRVAPICDVSLFHAFDQDQDGVRDEDEVPGCGNSDDEETECGLLHKQITDIFNEVLYNEKTGSVNAPYKLELPYSEEVTGEYEMMQNGVRLDESGVEILDEDGEPQPYGCFDLLHDAAASVFKQPEDYYHICETEAHRRTAEVLYRFCPDGLESCKYGKDYMQLITAPSFDAVVDRGRGNWRIWTGVGSSVKTEEAKCFKEEGGLITDASCFNDADSQGYAPPTDNTMLRLGEPALDRLLSGRGPNAYYAHWKYQLDYTTRCSDFSCMDRPRPSESKESSILINPALVKLGDSGTFDPGLDQAYLDPSLKNSFYAVDMVKNSCWRDAEYFNWGDVNGYPHGDGCGVKVSAWAKDGSRDTTYARNHDLSKSEFDVRFPLYNTSAPSGAYGAGNAIAAHCSLPLDSQEVKAYISGASDWLPVPEETQYKCDLGFNEFTALADRLSEDEKAHEAKIQLAFDIVSNVALIAATGGSSAGLKLATQGSRVARALHVTKNVATSADIGLTLASVGAEAFVYFDETVPSCRKMPNGLAKRQCFNLGSVGMMASMIGVPGAKSDAVDVTRSALKGVKKGKDDIADEVIDKIKAGSLTKKQELDELAEYNGATVSRTEIQSNLDHSERLYKDMLGKRTRAPDAAAEATPRGPGPDLTVAQTERISGFKDNVTSIRSTAGGQSPEQIKSAINEEVDRLLLDFRSIWPDTKFDVVALGNALKQNINNAPDILFKLDGFWESFAERINKLDSASSLEASLTSLTSELDDWSSRFKSIDSNLSKLSSDAQNNFVTKLNELPEAALFSRELSESLDATLIQAYIDNDESLIDGAFDRWASVYEPKPILESTSSFCRIN